MSTAHYGNSINGEEILFEQFDIDFSMMKMSWHYTRFQDYKRLKIPGIFRY